MVDIENKLNDLAKEFLMKAMAVAVESEETVWVEFDFRNNQSQKQLTTRPCASANRILKSSYAPSRVGNPIIGNKGKLKKTTDQFYLI